QAPQRPPPNFGAPSERDAIGDFAQAQGQPGPAKPGLGLTRVVGKSGSSPAVHTSHIRGKSCPAQSRADELLASLRAFSRLSQTLVSSRQRSAASAQPDILQLGERAYRNGLDGDKGFPQQVRRHHAAEQKGDTRGGPRRIACNHSPAFLASMAWYQASRPMRHTETGRFRATALQGGSTAAQAHPRRT